MTKKPSLYEILDVPPTADSAAIHRAWTIQLQDLDRDAEKGVSAGALASRKQIIQVAASTLLDGSSRLAYDAQLMRGSAASPLSAPGAGRTSLDLALTPVATSTAERDSMTLRADALALRAEAMSLRADALVLQSGTGSGSGHNTARSGGWLQLMASGPIWRIAIFLMVMGLVAMGWARCSADAPVRRSAAEGQAAERAALQDYFQTYGVRPANLAEMELLQAERRRSSNESRNAQQNVDQKVSAEVKFEQDARKRAQEVSDRLRADEEQQMRAAQRDALQAESMLKQRKETERLAEEQRIKNLEGQWQQIIRR